MMPLDRGDFLWRERARPLGGHASEAAVALMPPRAPGDLRHFGHGQPALAVAVELAQAREGDRSEEHTSELQSLMRISYAVFCLKKKKQKTKEAKHTTILTHHKTYN